MRQLAAEIVERLLRRVEAGHEALVDRHALGVALVAILGWNPLIAFNELGQRPAHQPARLLGERVENVGPGQSLLAEGKLLADTVPPDRKSTRLDARH